MSGKAGGRGGLVKNPKKTKWELDDDDDVLDNLVTETGQDKRQPTYSQLETGGFITKGADRKTRFDRGRRELWLWQGNQMKVKKKRSKKD